jgi:UDP-N-acetylmuramate dehydrogenase
VKSDHRWDEAFETLRAIEGLEVRRDEPLAPWTRFHAGGAADVLALPSTADAVVRIVRAARAHDWPLTVLGNGTNVLVADGGVPGVTVRLAPNFNAIRLDGTTLICDAGVRLCDVAATAARNGLSGMAFACGIPGSVGGAVYMNAGAYDGAMADVVVKTTFLDRDGNVRVVEGEAHDFGYRHSCFAAMPEALILSVTLALTPGDVTEIYDAMATYARKRYRSQPLAAHTGGSAFRRPEGHYAGKLISDAGYKGFRRGDAGVSDKHAGFIVNHGHATAEEIAAVFVEVRRAVYERDGVLLRPEVKPIGAWTTDPFEIQPSEA